MRAMYPTKTFPNHYTIVTVSAWPWWKVDAVGRKLTILHKNIEQELGKLVPCSS